MKLKLEILPKEQLELYPHLKVFKQMGFTLFERTAIALQLGHRQSLTFDFFTDKDVSNLKDKLLNVSDIKVGKILQQEENTLVYQTSSRAGIGHRKIYPTRHTFTTHLLNTSSLNIMEIARILGHSSVEMIFKTYGRFVNHPNAKDAWASCFNDRVLVSIMFP